MKKILTSFLFLIQILVLINLSNAQDDTSNTPVDINSLTLFYKIFETLEPVCLTEFDHIFKREEKNKDEKDKKYPWILDCVGKGLDDIGNEVECLYSMNTNTTFLMVRYLNMNISAFSEAEQPLIKFLEINKYAYGVCIMNPCVDAIKRIVIVLTNFLNYVSTNKISNESRVLFIKSHKGEKNSDNVNNDTDLETLSLKVFFICLFLLLVVLKILGSFIRIFIIPKGYEKYIAEKLNKSNSQEKEKYDIEEKAVFTSKIKFIEPTAEESNTKIYNPLFDFSDKLSKKVRTLRFFDILNDFHYLITYRNRYFDDSGLDVIIFNRALIIFFLIFSYTFSTLIVIPSEEIINKRFFKSWMNVLYRISNNASVCWIFSEGVYTTYKLLSFITSEMLIYYNKEGRKKVNLKIKLLIIYSKFLILLIAKILVFIIIYYAIYYKIEDYRFCSNSPATFKYIIENILKEKIECDSIFSIFNFGFSDDIKEYDKCYDFTYFFINMILCIFISMFIIYLFLVIQNIIFEIIMISLGLVAFFGTIVLVIDDKNNEGSLFLQYHIKGQTYTQKIFHSFIGFYHLGFIFCFLLFNIQDLKKKINRLLYEYNGLHLFQQKSKKNEKSATFSPEISTNLKENFDSFIDIDSNGESSKNESANLQKYNEDSPNYYRNFILPYYPLRYMNKIMYYISKFKFSTKIIFILGGLVLLCLNNTILMIPVFYSDTFDINLDFGKKFMFIYERHLFIIVYFMINIILITLPKNGAIRTFMKSGIFVATHRIGFIIICLVQAFMYLFFLIFFIKVKLYVPSFVLISLGNLLILFIICFLIASITELPLRIFIKKLMRIQRNKDNTTF